MIDIARINIFDYQSCFGHADNLVEIILHRTNGKQSIYSLYVEDKYEFKKTIDSCKEKLYYPSKNSEDFRGCTIL